MTEAEALAEVERFAARGDLLRAFDQACSRLKDHPESEKLKQVALLALARSGATDHALRLFREWGLARSADADILALQGRLAKDRALGLSGGARRAAMAEAASIYQAVNARSPAYYPAINAATTTLLAGDHETAADLARQVLADAAIANASGYWELVTRAEAACIIHDLDSVSTDLVLAAALNRNFAQRTTTRRQLQFVLAENGVGGDQAAQILAPLASPPSVHYTSTGASTFWPTDAAAECAMREAIDEVISAVAPGSAFGSILSAADIMFAEAALDAGVALEIILPIRPAVSRAAIANEAGEQWASRMEACCDHAQRVVLTSDDPEGAEASHLDFAARVGMGLTLLRAQHTDSEAIQIVLGERAAEEPAVARAWGHRLRRHVDLSAFASPRHTNNNEDVRPTHALIFADILGFSALQERLLPVFWETVMAAIGKVAETNKDVVFERNTWGDAVLLVCKDARSAARICIEVQRDLAQVDARRFDSGEPPSMRIGAHYGPVFTGWDPIAEKNTHYGRALSKAARIEPITPPGGVYVSEPFAAILLLEAGHEYACTYAGAVPLAKGYGEFRMYNLTLS